MLLKCLRYILALKGRKYQEECDIRTAILKNRNPSFSVDIFKLALNKPIRHMHRHKLDIQKLRNKQ